MENILSLSLDIYYLVGFLETQDTFFLNHDFKPTSYFQSTSEIIFSTVGPSRQFFASNNLHNSCFCCSRGCVFFKPAWQRGVGIADFFAVYSSCKHLDLCLQTDRVLVPVCGVNMALKSLFLIILLPVLAHRNACLPIGTLVFLLCHT